MVNSDVDPNISLGLNILEGCANVHRNLNHPLFGRDITDGNVDELLSCSFMLADAMRNAGATGTYYLMAPLYYEFLGHERRPEYWDSIRVLHLLKKYATNHSKAGMWPMPPVFKPQYSKHKHMMSSLYPVVLAIYGNALSYNPPVDGHWLGEDSIDVFCILGEAISDFYYEASSENTIQAPENPRNFARWIRNMALYVKQPNVLAFLYLTIFFPHSVADAIGFAGKKGRSDPSWIFKMCSVEPQSVYDNKLSLLKYGPSAVRRWLHVQMELGSV